MTDSTLPIDAELIEAVRRGQVDAFGSSYEWHVRAAYHLGRQFIRSRTESDDLVSAGFARGAEHLARRPRTRLGIPRVPADRTHTTSPTTRLAATARSRWPTTPPLCDVRNH